ncbi:MAG: hypothetical protein ACQEVA_22500, partial [Myxococcota bacterium]
MSTKGHKMKSLMNLMFPSRVSLVAVLAVALLSLTGCPETGEHDNNGDGDDAGDVMMSDAEDGGEDADDGGEDAEDVEMDVSACDPACEGETPRCKESTGECVECFTVAECDGDDVCTEAGRCAGCETDEHCDGDSVCAFTDDADPDNNECVPCMADDDCTDGVCIEASEARDNSCEECRDNAQCTDPAASLCEGNGCTNCAADADCTHLQDTTVCDTERDGGTCVECTEDADCGSGVCNVIDGVCTTIQAGSATTCEPCVADSQCEADHYCVPMEFNGSAHGNYCLKVFLDGVGCAGPYGTLETKTSLGGVNDEYCSLNESLTTCEALESLEAGDAGQCESGGSADDSLCGASGVDDGLCRTVGGLLNKCTYEC